MAGTADTTQHGTLTRPDGRVVGFAGHGDPGGGPATGCRPRGPDRDAALVRAADAFGADGSLRIIEDLGHLGIVSELVPALGTLG